MATGKFSKIKNHQIAYVCVFRKEQYVLHTNILSGKKRKVMKGEIYNKLCVKKQSEGGV